MVATPAPERPHGRNLGTDARRTGVRNNRRRIRIAEKCGNPARRPVGKHLFPVAVVGLQQRHVALRRRKEEEHPIRRRVNSRLVQRPRGRKDRHPFEFGIAPKPLSAVTVGQRTVDRPEVEQRCHERLRKIPQPLVTAQRRLPGHYGPQGRRRVHAQRREDAVARTDDQFMFQRSFHCA